jgi:cytochrome c-type biogenesis protein CcmH/NrfG
MPFWVPIAIAAIVVVAAVCLDVLRHHRRHAKARAEAREKFRAAFFTESIAHLDKISADVLMNHAQPRHDAAIAEFRQSLHPGQLEDFGAAVRKFHLCRSQLQPKLTKIRAAIASNMPVDNSDTTRLKEALAELLAFAEKTD